MIAVAPLPHAFASGTLSSFLSLAGERAINSVAEGILVAVLAWALLRVSACRNSGTRFAVWFSALLAIGALSIFCFSLRVGEGSVSSVPGQISLPRAWLYYGFLIWAVIASFGFLRIARSLWQVRSLRRRSRRVSDTEIDPVLQQTLADFGSLRPVKLSACDELRVPAAVGFFKPAVIIPEWALRELSVDELNSVLLHELGHLRRWDDWTNLAQKLLRALLFFHPAVWWIDSRLTLEREMACDDLVLARTTDAGGYARCIVSVAEKSLLRTGLALALAVVSRMRQTAARLTRILDPNRVTETRVSKPALAGISAIALAAMIALPNAPTLVVFQNGAAASVGDRVQNVATANSTSSIHVVKANWNVNGVQARVVPNVLRRSFVNSQQRFSFQCEIKTKSPAEAGRNHTGLGTSDRAVRPRVIKTALRSSSTANGRNPDQLNAGYPAFLVVIQTEEFEASGASVWSVRVLRFTFAPNQKQVQSLNGTSANSI